MTMTLHEYTEVHGLETTARIFKVTERAIASWVRGERRPNRQNALFIVQASNGQISLEEALNPTTRKVKSHDH